MSKFTYYPNGERHLGLGTVPVYESTLDSTGETLGLVARNDRSGWSAFYAGHEVCNFSTRNRASEYLLVRYLMDVNDPVVMSALPADPFDGVSA